MAIADITKPMALDETLQATNGKMDTVVTKLQGIIDALGVDTSVYKAAGNKTCAELVPGLLVASNLGNVYNMTDSGTTTSDFVEGAGKEIHVGDNVAIVDVGTGGSNVYKFDLLAGMVDLTNYIQKSSTAGLVKNDGTIDTSSYATTSQIPDISGKADKVTSATNGNLAGLNASGNLTDSGWDGAKTTTSASGNPISITGLKSNQLAVNPVITFEPIQAGSGDPSPSNVRAISGYDKIEVLSCGKNLFDGIEQGSWNISNGTKIASTNRCRLTHMYNLGASQYVLSAESNVSGKDALIAVQEYTYSNGAYTNTFDSGWQSSGYSFTTIQGRTYTFIFSLVNNPDVTPESFKKIQLEQGSSATTYEPYHKTTDLSEPLPQTVYGMTLYPREGKGVIDRAIYVYDGSETWSTYNSGYYCTSFTLPKAQQISNSITNSFAYEYPATNGKYKFVETSGRYSPHFFYNGVSDANGWKTYLQSNNIQFVYPLETPIEIQLTPHEISLLKDYAYVSTNGTSIALDYHNGEIATLGDVSQLGETVNELGNVVSKLIKIDTVNIAVGNNKITTSYKSADYVLISAIQINSNTSVAGTVRAYIDNGYWVIQTDSVQVNTAKIRLLFTANL